MILPSLSVIIPNYNHGHYLPVCLEAILSQSFSASEIIIVDDGSRDHTSSVISNLKELTGIKIIKNKKNLGLPKSINIAIKAALGRYIVRVDSDDYISRNFLYISKLF